MAAVIFTGARLLKQPAPGLIGVAYVKVNNYATSKNPLNLAMMRKGTGGRSSFNGIVATVFGATGFLGRYVCNKLGKMGTQIIVPYRSEFMDVSRLKVCGDLGQVLFLPFHLQDETSIRKAMKYSNVVINLIGRDWETKNFKFEDVHVKGAQRIARIAKEMGVERLIHLSALNASEYIEPHYYHKGSHFLMSKFAGEQAVMSSFPEATIFRPSDIYGSEDRFLRYYAHVWRRTAQMLPMWKMGEETIKQPVFVSNVAEAIMNTIKDPETAGKLYQAVGPQRFYLSELVDWFYTLMRKDREWGYFRYDMRLDPFFKMRVAATEMFSPGFPVGNLTFERIERECITDRLDYNLPTLEDLDVTLTKMEHQVPWELKPFSDALYYSMAADEPFPNPKPPREVA